MPLLSVVRIFLLTMTVSASPLGRLQLCGSELANKLAEICSIQGYNDPFRHSMYYEVSPFEGGVSSTTRSKRGVADECCKTGCSWDTLEQYCNPPLSTPDRPHNLQETEDHSINHIAQVDSEGSAGQPTTITREQKNDLVSKVRSHHEKKGRRGNNRCRCRRRRRRGKGDIEDPEILENKIAPVIGTINPAYFANPVILPPRIRKEEMALQDTK
ncbi:insulin-like growth factor I, juvenile form [Zootermopsis nevadensis]|uniref:Insulin-like peptide n=1 Tax=Zootermopsis nevadensis TaxID=136037 RepID=A0A067RFE1_ZOONE|nr:insulin-like growth factor I, juvenile form [Zootermopsis nevadensis]KDR22482.1 Insulin-like peptide [Zootermopsis nevadensis]